MNYQKQLENLFNNILVIIYNILPHPNCSEEVFRKDYHRSPLFNTLLN